MRVVGISGSLQAQSSNRALLRRAAELAPRGVHFESFEGLAGLPQFNPDLEVEAPLPSVEEWRRALATSHAVLIACPEYGFSLPGSLKNAIDWVIGTGELERKTVAITASTPHPDRGRRGLAALRDTLGALSVTIVGGEPLVRGPAFDQELTALMAELVRAASAAAVP